MTLHSPGAVPGQGTPAKTLTVAHDGFSLNAPVVCEAHQCDKLERLCRYVSRGPIALERLSIDGDGLVVNAQGSAGAAKHMDVRERPMHREVPVLRSTWICESGQ